jgi:hypothetical protein
MWAPPWWGPHVDDPTAEATTAEDLIPIFGSRLAADAKCVLSLPTLLEAVFFPNNTIKYAF